jgi:hypothetical protein
LLAFYGAILSSIALGWNICAKRSLAFAPSYDRSQSEVLR